MSVAWTVYGKIATVTKVKNSVTTTISYTYDASGNRISKAVEKAGNMVTTWYVRDASGNVMSLYEEGNSAINSGALSQTELHVYGSSRLGVYRCEVNMVTLAPPATGLITLTRGLKNYELTNHLGNVLAVISDKKVLVKDKDNGECLSSDEAMDILNKYQHNSTTTLYIARQEINFLGEFSSNNGDEFEAYINNSLDRASPQQVINYRLVLIILLTW